MAYLERVGEHAVHATVLINYRHFWLEHAEEIGENVNFSEGLENVRFTSFQILD